MTSLDILIEAILNKSDTHGTWHISREDILEILSLDIRDVYHLIVASTNPLVSFRTSEYSQNDVGALICLLEEFNTRLKKIISFYNICI